MASFLCRRIQAAHSVTPAVEAAIQGAIDRCLTKTNLSIGKQTVVSACHTRHFLTLSLILLVEALSTGHCTWLRVGQGKVRDTYDCGSHIVIVTSDRQSAFDRLLASVPYKVCMLTVRLYV